MRQLKFNVIVRDASAQKTIVVSGNGLNQAKKTAERKLDAEYAGMFYTIVSIDIKYR